MMRTGACLLVIFAGAASARVVPTRGGATCALRPVALRSVRMYNDPPSAKGDDDTAAAKEDKMAIKSAPKAAAATAPVDTFKPSVPFGNGVRPRDEWAADAGYGRYAGTRQAEFSRRLPREINLPTGTITIPEFERPRILDGTHAGDYGFDVLGFAKDEATLRTMLESELRHGRLAMLATLGWVFAELFAEGGLASGGRAPSIPNGHLFTLQNFLGTALIFASVARTEADRDSTTGAKVFDSEAEPGMYDWHHYLDGPFVPGCYNWDPLGAASPPPRGSAQANVASLTLAVLPEMPPGLYGILGNDAAGRRAMRELEIQHGRVAMIAITLWVMWEASTHVRTHSPAPKRATWRAQRDLTHLDRCECRWRLPRPLLSSSSRSGW